MDPYKWFKTFIKEYRSIIKEKYENYEYRFLFYQPIEIHAYLIDDKKGIFPDVVLYVIFIDEDNEQFLSDDVFIIEKDIEWPEDFDNLYGYEKEFAYWETENATFKESSWPISSIRLSYSKSIFESNPKDRAEILVNEHFISGFERSLVKKHMEKCIIRMKNLGVGSITQLISQLENIQNIVNDEDIANLISKTFWILGFEILNLEKLKHHDEYKKLNNIAHVDVIALLPNDKILVAIEEGTINKDRWYKLSTLNATLEQLDIEEDDWTSIIIMIGKESRGVSYLTGNVRKISHEDFFEIIKRFIERKKKRWSINPALEAIWGILGREIKIFKI